MILGTGAEQLELTVLDVERDVARIAAGGDVLVAVRARVRDFSGAVEAWVLRDAWAHFLGQLARLEAARTGEAVLESVSPGELRLRLFAVDRAGHMAAEGEIAAVYTAVGRSRRTGMSFAPIAVDPTALPTLLRELQRAAPPG